MKLGAPILGATEEATMGTILVVDDEIDLADMLQIVLCDSGHHVHCLTRHEQGQTWIQAFLAKVAEGLEGVPFDIVVLDTQLRPDGDGRDLARALSAQPEPRPKIFLASAMATRPAGVDALLAKRVIAGFFPKPFDIAELLATIARAIAVGSARVVEDAHPAH